MAHCICQRAYDTGYTGVAKIDARLQAHYDHWLDTDSIRRSYDHVAFHIPYSDVPRSPYCFITGKRGRCPHEHCEHQRYRPPTTVAKMRFYIERVCPADVHYPELVADIDRSGDTRPEMDNDVHLRQQWDERQFKLHRWAGTSENPQREQQVTPRWKLTQDWIDFQATQLTGLDPEPVPEAVLQAEAGLTALSEAAAVAAEDAFWQMMDELTDDQLAQAIEYGVDAVAA